MSNSTKKMFLINEDGIAEWVVAFSKEQAIDYYQHLTGGSLTQDFNEEQADGNSQTWEEFIDSTVKEEALDKVFTYHDYCGKGDVQKTVSEFLEDVTEVPSYFACSEY